MNTITKTASSLIALAIIATPAGANPAGQEMAPPAGEADITVYGSPPADLSGFPAGPELEGFITERDSQRLMVASNDGTNTNVLISEGTEIRGRGGFLGLARTELAASELFNGLPVTVETVRWGGALVAREIKFKKDDLQTAAMIHNGTDGRFNAQSARITANAAAAEALRGRMGDIDKYNIKGTTNVYFDTGRHNLSPQAEAELCAAANEADATENALLLVVGYTDSVGNQDFNQTLSEKRAGRVVNFLQQQCGWKPWRMLSPTGMAESDPLADNSTAEGRQQNRRVSVNILVSKAVEEETGG